MLASLSRNKLAGTTGALADINLQQINERPEYGFRSDVEGFGAASATPADSLTVVVFDSVRTPHKLPLSGANGARHAFPAADKLPHNVRCNCKSSSLVTTASEIAHMTFERGC